MLRCRFVALGVALALIATAAAAQDYFVAPDGNDANPGTLEKPKKNAVKAAKLLKAGDTLYFRKGTYRCRTNGIVGLAPSRHGEEGKPITFKNYNNEHVKIDVANTDWGFTSNGFSYIVIDGFEVTGGGRNFNMKIASNHGGGTRGCGHHVTIRNCDVHGAKMVNIFAFGTKYLTVENCHLHHSRRSHGIYLSAGCHNSVIRNVTSEHNHGNSGLQINAAGNGTKNVLVEKCILRYNAHGFSLMSAIDCIFRNNIVFNDGYDGPRGSGWREIIMYTYGKNKKTGKPMPTEGLLFENNTFVNLVPKGHKLSNLVRSKSGSRNCKFRNNIFVVRGKPIFTLESYAGFSFENNCLFNIKGGGQVKGGGNLADFCKAKKLTESGTITKDPMFVDIKNGDLRLKEGSPCIDAGVDAPSEVTAGGAEVSPKVKVGGKARDIGAYENGVDFQMGCKLPWKKDSGSK